MMHGLPQPGPPPNLRMRGDSRCKHAGDWTAIRPRIEHPSDYFMKTACNYDDSMKSCGAWPYLMADSGQRILPSVGINATRYADIHCRSVPSTPQQRSHASTTTLAPEPMQGATGFSEDALREALRALMPSEPWCDTEKFQRCGDIELEHSMSRDVHGYPLSVTCMRSGHSPLQQDVVDASTDLPSARHLQRPPCIPAQAHSSRTSRVIPRSAWSDSQSCESIGAFVAATRESVSSVARKAFSESAVPSPRASPHISPRALECCEQVSSRTQLISQHFDVSHASRYSQRSRSSSRDSRDARRPWR